jgi:phage tail-like protein
MYLELPRLRVHRVSAIESAERIALINRHPGSDEQNVAINSAIELSIVDFGTDGIDTAFTRVWVSDVLAFDAVIQAGFDGPRSLVVETADSLQIILDPLVPFESESQVSVHVITQTLGGAYSLDETYSFTVEDRTAPKVIAAEAVGSKTVRVGFDEEVVVWDPTGFLFEAKALPAVPILPVAATASQTLVDIALDPEMTPAVQYELTVQGVIDTNDNPVLPPYDTVRFTGFRPAVPPDRRFRLWEMVPKHNRRADDTGDLRRFISCLQEVTELILAEIDRYPDIFDIERASEGFLDLILQDLGNPFKFDLNALDKARLASILVELYKQKGTEKGIVNAIRFFMGLEVEVLPLTADLLGLGEAEIGVNWILGTSERYALYSFNIRVDRELSETEKKQLRDIVELVKPGHTHFIELLMPGPPPSDDAWVIGVSVIGVDSRLSPDPPTLPLPY